LVPEVEENDDDSDDSTEEEDEEDDSEEEETDEEDSGEETEEDEDEEGESRHVSTHRSRSRVGRRGDWPGEGIRRRSPSKLRSTPPQIRHRFPDPPLSEDPLAAYPTSRRSANPKPFVKSLLARSWYYWVGGSFCLLTPD